MDVFREISLAYFSPSHLAKVSATCRTLRALASDIMHWRNKVLFLECGISKFGNPAANFPCLRRRKCHYSDVQATLFV